MMRFQWTTRGLVAAACFGALLVMSSFLNLYLGFSPVPISMQNLVIMLAGALLGAGYGFFSIGLVVGLSALGLPLFHGNGGLALILGKTGGFIWMYPVAAFFIGYFARKIKGNGLGSLLLLFGVMEVFGSLLLYVTGVPWFAHAADVSTSKALALACYPYLPGDAVKALVAAYVVLTVRKVFPQERLTGTSSSSTSIAA